MHPSSSFIPFSGFIWRQPCSVPPHTKWSQSWYWDNVGNTAGHVTTLMAACPPQPHSSAVNSGRKALVKSGKAPVTRVLAAAEAALVPVCCQGLSDTAGGSSVPEHRMDSAPHQELGVSAPTPLGHRAGNKSRPQGKCFARFRSEHTREQ